MKTRQTERCPQDMVENSNLRTQRMVYAFEQLYVSNRQRFVQMTNGKAFIPTHQGKSKPLSGAILEAHIKGDYAVAVFAEKSGSKFICFDVDDGSQETVRRLQDALEVLGISRDRIYVSISGGKGYHVEVFFSDIVPDKLLRMLYQDVRTGGRVSHEKVEFRPSYGQAVKLPLGTHYKTGETAWFVDGETLEPIKKHEYIFLLRQVEAELIHDLYQGVTGMPMDDEDANSSPDVTGSSCGVYEKYCLKPLEAHGTRHNMMRAIAIRQRSKGVSKQECLAHLLSWVSVQDPGYIHSSREEVRKDAKELVNWAYGKQFASYGQKPIALTTYELEAVACVPGLTGRKLLFMILAMRRANWCSITRERLGEAIGVCKKTVTKMLRDLQTRGLIQITQRKAIKTPDGFFRPPNIYVPTLQDPARKDQQSGPGRYEFTMEQLLSDFDTVFFQAFFVGLGPMEAMKRFDQKGLAKLQRALDKSSPHAAKNKRRAPTRTHDIDLPEEPRTSRRHSGNTTKDPGGTHE